MGATAVFNLLTIEMINATFDGATLRAGTFQALGELRAVQLQQADETHKLELRLESVANVRGIQANPALLHALDSATAFAVLVAPRPAAELSKPLALLRYCSTPEYAPIPLRVVPRWTFKEGIDHLELRVAAHPNLKAGLTNVIISVKLPHDVVACRAQPSGEWKAPARTLIWKIAHLPPSATPMPFSADFATGGAPIEGRSGQQLTVQFASETCNLTGLQPHLAPSLAIGRMYQRFVSGKYVINCS
jgi:hypothetical protein